MTTAAQYIASNLSASPTRLIEVRACDYEHMEQTITALVAALREIADDHDGWAADIARAALSETEWQT